jgi:Domain of unknown function (DUF4396)
LVCFSEFGHFLKRPIHSRELSTNPGRLEVEHFGDGNSEVLVQVYTPDITEAHLIDGIFWIGILMGLVAGFLAAFPVNYFFIRKGIRHHY